MKDELNKDSLTSLLKFPFNINFNNTALDNKWNIYKNVLGHIRATRSDPKLSDKIVITPHLGMTEDALKELLDTLFYGIAYGSVKGWKADDWLARYAETTFKNGSWLEDIEYDKYHIVKILPYFDPYGGFTPYSENQYLFIKCNESVWDNSNAPITLVENIPVSIDNNSQSSSRLYWQGYTRGIFLDTLYTNRVFFTSESNLIAGASNSFGEQTLLADLLDE